MTIISERRKIRNYIEFHRLPFTQNDVIKTTGCNKRTVQNNIRVFELNGIIKTIAKQEKHKIYVKIRKKKDPPSWDFSPNRAKLIKIVEIIKQHGLVNSSIIAESMEMSHEMICRYLNVLIVLRTIKRTRYGYIVLNTNIPTHIKKYSYYLNLLHLINARKRMGEELIKALKKYNYRKISKQRKMFLK